MKYLGIDFGSQSIGIAISNDTGTMAFPRAEIANDTKARDFILRMISDEGIEKLVVGDTRAFNGNENRITEQADKFIKELTNSVSIPVAVALEAGSSVEAARFAPKGHTHNNASAAAIILQRFFDMRTSGVE